MKKFIVLVFLVVLAGGGCMTTPPRAGDVQIVYEYENGQPVPAGSTIARLGVPNQYGVVEMRYFHELPDRRLIPVRQVYIQPDPRQVAADRQYKLQKTELRHEIRMDHRKMDHIEQRESNRHEINKSRAKESWFRTVTRNNDEIRDDLRHSADNFGDRLERVLPEIKESREYHRDRRPARSSIRSKPKSSGWKPGDNARKVLRAWKDR